MANWYLIYAYALGFSFLVSGAITEIVRRLALRWGLLDHPGERKVHRNPIPLMGGVAIFLTFYLTIGFHLLQLGPVRKFGIEAFLPNLQYGFEWYRANVLSFLGGSVMLKLLGLFSGSLVIFVLGVIDDIKPLSPEKKLIGQILAASLLVSFGIRLELFVVTPWITGPVTVLWLVLMINSLNFLDNMDGLCGGVSIIAALSFFFCLFPNGHTFVCVILMVFIGSVGGFLYHNLNPARIFMGDAGSMFCGLFLGTVSVLGTFYQEGTPSRVAIAAPLLALSVPLFDTCSVLYIRWRNGESLMKGDKRHFSHRLVDLGMTHGQAVEFIYLVAIIAGLGAMLLPMVSPMGTIVIIVQTLGLFCIIAMLMHIANQRRETRREQEDARPE